jgi:hypothetical protein
VNPLAATPVLMTGAPPFPPQQRVTLAKHKGDDGRLFVQGATGSDPEILTQMRIPKEKRSSRSRPGSLR